MRPTTAIALSGGIDSLVTAALLKDRGHQLIGLHFITGFESTTTRIVGGLDFRPQAGKPKARQCFKRGGCNRVQSTRFENNQSGGTQAAVDPKIDTGAPPDQARPIQDRLNAMMDKLDIPIHIIDLRQEFKSKVVDYFTSAYQSGRTPNPCLVCNPIIKFELLFNKGRSLGAQSIATGHYARILPGSDGRMHLLRGVDFLKDQSYFLGRLTQEQLSRTLLPLGDITKDQTRQIAHQKGLRPAAPTESQDICFIQNGKYGEFIEQQPGFVIRSGPIEDLSGKIVGQHKGLHLFTIGQRRGINCPAEAPYYVHHLDMARNCLVVGFKKDLYRSACRVSDINWIAPPPADSVSLEVRLRYRHTAVRAILTPLDRKRADISFEAPQEAVTPGQGAVFYQDDDVLGAGWIE